MLAEGSRVDIEAEVRAAKRRRVMPESSQGAVEVDSLADPTTTTEEDPIAGVYRVPFFDFFHILSMSTSFI